MVERWLVLVLSSGLGLAGLAAAATLAAESQTVLLRGAWVRALPPGQPSTAGYLTVENTGSDALVISGASANISSRVELHNSREVDGMMRMERVEQLVVAPGEVVEFVPGGMHLMLLDLHRMPVEGETVSMCLQPAGLKPVCTDARVLRDADRTPAQQHQHH